MSRWSFDAAEYSRRLTAVQNELKARQIDFAVITRPQNIFYLTGFRAAHFASHLSELHAVLVPAQGQPRLMTRALERAVAQLQWAPNPVLYMDHEDPYARLCETVAKLETSGRRVGFEERFMSVRQFQRLTAALKPDSTQDVTGLVEKVACVTHPADIACIRKAAKMTQAGFHAGIAATKVGVYPYEIVGAIHSAMYQAGQSDFDMAMVCVWGGQTGGRMHDTDTTERLSAGDAVTIEIFGVDNQYKVGAQGTIFAGQRPSQSTQESFRTLVDMFHAGRSVLRAGVTSSEVFDAANGPYRAKWGADYYRKVGGSMGLTIFEIPLVKGNHTPLRAGTCLLMQTLVDDPVLLTCSSTVLVTETGYETLTDPITDMMIV